jgi:glycosyltransferase involved in cell wall biosynthesis
MPLHNGADKLQATLETLRNEYDGDFEVIAIDSSADDETSKIASEFASCLPIDVIRRPDMIPWPAKTNLAVELARTDYLCMLHQDDLWLPGRMAAVRRWIDSAPDSDLHLAPSVFIDGKGRQLGSWTCPLPAECRLDRDLILSRLLVQNFVAVPAPIFRRQAWIDCGGMDVGLWYTADWDIWLRLAQAGKVVYHEDVTSAFRIHGKSLTMSGSRNAIDFREQMEIVLSRHLEGVGPAIRAIAEPLGRASIEVNVAMAAAARGSLRDLAKASCAMVDLGLTGTLAYLRASRLHQRVFARFRAKLSGSLS